MVREVRCPRCQAALTPDEIRRADPAIDCPFCKMRVLVKPLPPDAKSAAPDAPREAHALVPAPLKQPHYFIVVESAPPPAPVGDDSTPYRTAPELPLERPRPTLSITWPIYRQSRLALMAGVGWFLAIAAVCIVLGLRQAEVGAIVLGGIISVIASWFGLAGMLNKVGLEAGRHALVLRYGPIPPVPSTASLFVDDIAQLFVTEDVKRSKRDVYRSYNVYARDRAGRDRLIAIVDTPEEAWWLEDRLERHLGIVDHPVSQENETRRPMQLVAGPLED